MKQKQDIVENWLPRYTGTALNQFGPFIVLTNFNNYLDFFARLTNGVIRGRDRPMPNATGDGITMINFGMGSANADHPRSAVGDRTESRAVPRQVRRPEEEEPDR
jgi:AMP nucleosidase